MNPMVKTIDLKQWQCGNCKRLHSNEGIAKECCLCEVCEKRIATEKLQGYEPRPTHCEQCWRARKRKVLRADIAVWEKRIVEAQAKVNDYATRKREAESELAKLTTSKVTPAPTPVEPEAVS